MLLIIGHTGASLFFGDAMITAIFRYSQIEGVEIVTPLLKPYVVPLAGNFLESYTQSGFLANRLAG